MQLLYRLDQYVLWACWIAALPFGTFALVDVVRSRPDAFTAADKLTKPAWLAITGGGLAVLVLTGDPFNPLGPLTGGSFWGGPWSLVWLVGLIAVLVYLVDVRPSLIEVQGGRR